MIIPLQFSIGILSWNGYDSLQNSLETYKKNGLSKLTNHRFICLPEYKKEGIEISKSYGYEPILIKENLGILGGFKALVEKMPLGPILLLENDLPLIEDQTETYNQISKSIDFLLQKKVIQVRLRSRSNPGEPFVGLSKYNDIWSENILSTFKRKLRPIKAKKLIGTSVYALQNPDLRHPKYVTKLSSGFYSVESNVLNWANLAILVDKKNFLNIIIKRAELVKSSKKINGFKNIEVELNGLWWRQQKFEIVLAPGLFTHYRLSGRGY
ncbi:hypothetical protein N9O69_04985 [Alphaproteobacteria bacterium]|nr:hypothetical protein [Alphaproteobacteria bacterium]